MPFYKKIALALQLSSLTAIVLLWWFNAPIWASAVLLLPIIVLPLLKPTEQASITPHNNEQTTELARHLSHATTASAINHNII